MLNKLSFTGRITFFQKIRSLDYWLLVCILLLGLISSFSMYSSEGGQILYYTKSHIIRFTVFFSLMLALSFVRPKFWHATGYLFFVIVMSLLFYVSLFCITASG